MKQHLHLLLFTLLLLQPLAVRAQDQAEYWARTLSSFQCRVPGSDSLSSAADFIAGEAEALGLHVDRDVFSLPVWDGVEAKLRVEAPVRMEIPCTAYPFCPSTEGWVTGSLVYSATGVKPSNYKDSVLLAPGDAVDEGFACSVYGFKALIVGMNENGWVKPIPNVKSVPAVIVGNEDFEMLKGLVVEYGRVNVSIMVKTEIHLGKAENIVAWLNNGSEGPIALLICHYDQQLHLKSQSTSDSAVPVAVLLDAARKLRDLNVEIPVVFVFTSGRLGNYGVRIFASRHYDIINRVFMAVEIDNLGVGKPVIRSYYDAKSMCESYPYTTWLVSELISSADIVDYELHTVFPSIAEEFPQVSYLLSLNVPAVMISSNNSRGFSGSLRDTADAVEYGQISLVSDVISLAVYRASIGASIEQPENLLREGKTHPHRVSGYVFMGGKPVPGAYVVVRRMFPPPTTFYYNITGQGGFYEVRGLPFGLYEVICFTEPMLRNLMDRVFIPGWAGNIKLDEKIVSVNLNLTLHEGGLVRIGGVYDPQTWEPEPPPLRVDVYHGRGVIYSTQVFSRFRSFGPQLTPGLIPCPAKVDVKLKFYFKSSAYLLTNGTGFNLEPGMEVYIPSIQSFIFREKAENLSVRLEALRGVGYNVKYFLDQLNVSLSHIVRAEDAAAAGEHYIHIAEAQEAARIIEYIEAEISQMVYVSAESLEYSLPIMSLISVLLAGVLESRRNIKIILAKALLFSMLLSGLILFLNPAGRILISGGVEGWENIVVEAAGRSYLAFTVAFFLLYVYMGVAHERPGLKLRFFSALNAIVRTSLEYIRKERWRSASLIMVLMLVTGSAISFTTTEPAVTSITHSSEVESRFQGVYLAAAGDPPIPREYLDVISSIPGVKKIHRVGLTHLASDYIFRIGGMEIWGVIAVDEWSARALFLDDALIEGSFEGVVIPSGLARNLSISVNETLRISGVDVKVSGIFNESKLLLLRDPLARPLLPTMLVLVTVGKQTMMRVAYVDPGSLLIISENLIDTFNIEVRRLIVEVAMPLAWDAAWSMEKLPGVEAYLIVENKLYDLILLETISFRGLGADLPPLITAILLSISMLLALLEHRRSDFYTMATLGLNPSHIEGLVLSFSITLCLIGSGLGIIFSTLLSRVSGILGIPVKVSYSGSAMALWIELMVAGVIIGSVIPARHAFMEAIPSLLRRWKLKASRGAYETRLPVRVPEGREKQFLSALVERVGREYSGTFTRISDVSIHDSRAEFDISIGEYGEFVILVSMYWEKPGESPKVTLRIKSRPVTESEGRVEKPIRELLSYLRRVAIELVELYE